MNIDILFLGGTSIDLIQDKTRPEKFLTSVGGSVTNSAIIASKLGLKTAMLSRVGGDPLGDFAVKFLGSCKVNTSGIILDSNIRTSLAIANIDNNGNSKYTFYKNSPKDAVVPLKSAPKNLLRACRIFHFGSSFSYQKETFEESLKYIKHLKRRGVFISFDPNLRSYAIKDKKQVKNRVLKLLKLVNMAKLSLLDLVFLTGKKDPEKGLKWLKNRFKCEVVLTLGSKGSMYLNGALPIKPMSLRGVKRRSNLIKVPAFKVKITDTIGAGDAFTAGLLYKIAKTGEKQVFKDMRPNLIFASAVSAIICTASGANQGLKSTRQITTFLARHL